MWPIKRIITPTINVTGLNKKSADNWLTIEAIIAVAESFGFVEEIRKKSSGLTNPMLQFYKWKILNVDPFDIASEEDILNYGINVDTKNIAKNYINKIRQRKGLLTNEKLISNSDKQRNLAKKK